MSAPALATDAAAIAALQRELLAADARFERTVAALLTELHRGVPETMCAGAVRRVAKIAGLDVVDDGESWQSKSVRVKIRKRKEVR